MRVRNPRNGQFDYSFTPATVAEVGETAKRLRANQPQWLEKGLDYRIDVLGKWADAVTKYRDDIAAALTIDTGRAWLSGREVEGLIRNIQRWRTTAPTQIQTEVLESKILPGVSYKNQYVPYQLVGAISPWNFPVTLSFIDAIPALIAGAAVVLKPSEITPRFVDPILRSLEDVPELRAVFEIVLGDGAIGAEVVNHVDAVCFTGSVPTGRKVAEAAAKRFIPAFLELGGKDPVIVLAGADLEKASDAVLKGSVINNGHACLSIERVYVQDSIYDEFVTKLVAKANDVSLNADNINEGEIGPFIHFPQADVVDRHLKDAYAKGARALTGGAVEDHGGGKWCRPTVLIDVNHDMDVMREETFGPIMPVMKFSTVDEAVLLANDTEFGLSGAVIGRTIEEAATVGERINAGGITINDTCMTYMTYEPEKNSFKYSGLGGSRMGPAGLMRFFRKKALIMQSGDPLTIFSMSENQVTSQ